MCEARLPTTREGPVFGSGYSSRYGLMVGFTATVSRMTLASGQVCPAAGVTAQRVRIPCRASRSGTKVRIERPRFSLSAS